MTQKPLYIFVLCLSALLVFIALGGGLFGQTQPWFNQWQHKLFHGLCHQQPDRSFWINGQPMAVCSRCFGIYTGLLGGLIAILFVGKRIKMSFIKKTLLVILIVNIVDVLINILALWNNTLLSRYTLGFLLAATAGLLLGKAFVKPSTLTKRNNNGTTRTV